MLSLVLSTIAFFVAAFFLNRYLDDLGVASSLSRKILVGTLAMVISVGAGWVIDELDGDGKVPGKNESLATAGQSGDTTRILKALSGIK